MTLNQLESFISFVRARFNGGTVRNCVIAVRNCDTLSGIVIFGFIAKSINYIKYKHSFISFIQTKLSIIIFKSAGTILVFVSYHPKVNWYGVDCWCKFCEEPIKFGWVECTNSMCSST